MRKLGLCLLLLTLVTLASAQTRTAPLLALRQARAGFENIIWMEQRTKLGGQSVTGYIQGTGGADDALMGFEFSEDWDMLVAVIGFKDSTPEGREAEFTIESGTETLYSSGTIQSRSPAHEVRIPIKGHRRILLRITSERYNGTAGAAWGQPTLLFGLTDAEMKNDWNLSVNKRKTPLPGQSAPSSVLIPFDVPSQETVEYRVKVSKDSKNRTVIVEKEKEDS